MSGIEALYWYQKYPEEVSAVIGLDVARYEAYESKWLNIQRDLYKNSKYGKIIYYDCPHYIHNHQAKEIRIFLLEQIIDSPNIFINHL